jgi:hypothetical protein
MTDRPRRRVSCRIDAHCGPIIIMIKVGYCRMESGPPPFRPALVCKRHRLDLFSRVPLDPRFVGQ